MIVMKILIFNRTKMACDTPIDQIFVLKCNVFFSLSTISFAHTTCSDLLLLPAPKIVACYV